MWWRILCFFVLTAVAVQARPVDLSAPENHVGAASLEGEVQLWREVADIDAGQDFTLPLRFNFNSGRDYASPYLGKGWWLPLLESSAVRVREKMMKVNLLCGKTLYLRRDDVDPAKFTSLDKQWKGLLDGSRFTVSRDDGWELVFNQGKIKQLTTDTHRVFQWHYDGETALGIQEEGTLAMLVSVHKDLQGNPDGILAAGKLYPFSLDKRPQVTIMAGQMVVKGFDLSLSQWTWPDGKKEGYQFAVKEKNPDLVVTDKKGKADTYVWDAETKKIVAEDGWKYAVGKVSASFGLPPISRTNPAGQTEGIAIDTKTGQTTRTSLAGVKTVYSEIQTPGPLYGKVRRVEKTVGGVTTQLYRAAYDDAGRLLRKTDEKGFTTSFKYDPTGKLLSQDVMLPSDPAIVKALKAKEAELLQKVVSAPNEEKKGDALQKLGFFYIRDKGTPQKAMALLPQMGNRKQIFNIKLHSIMGDRSLSWEKKVDGLNKLLNEYPEHQNILNAILNAKKT